MFFVRVVVVVLIFFFVWLGIEKRVGKPDSGTRELCTGDFGRA